MKHDNFLLKRLKNLEQKVNQNEEKLKEKDREIQELKDINDTRANIMRKIIDKTNRLTNTVDSLQKQITDLKAVQMQQSGRVDNLEKFAERSSRLHSTLSHVDLQMNDHHHSKSLFQKEYTRNAEVTKWNKLITEANQNGHDAATPIYLKKLTESLNNYHKTIHCPTYKERLDIFARKIPSGYFFGKFVKIRCVFNSIHVKIFDNFEDFTREFQRNDEVRYCKVHNHVRICAYYVDRRVHVLLFLNKGWKAYLLHNSTEGERLLLNKQYGVMEKTINDISKYKVQKSIMIYYEND